jgi:hypothetical protein
VLFATSDAALPVRLAILEAPDMKDSFRLRSCLLSSDKDVVLCLVEEHVMASSSEMCSQGKRKWRLSHEGKDGPKGLATDGDLPESFPAIRKEMEEAQHAAGGDDADVDYIFEIPLKLAEALGGVQAR